MAVYLPKGINTLGTDYGLCKSFLLHTAKSDAHAERLRRFSLQFDATEKRAHSIIYDGTYGMSYTSTVFLAGLMNLTECREQLARNFF